MRFPIAVSFFSTSCAGKSRSKLINFGLDLIATALAISANPKRRAVAAGTGSVKKSQRWAPSPEREISGANGIPSVLAARITAFASSRQVFSSKSKARNRQCVRLVIG